jgi:3-isopropylmalate dehydrogenase
MSKYRIAVIGGDGIGPEVMTEALKVLRAVTSPTLSLSWEEAEAGAALWARTGEDLPKETLALCQAADAILFGATGLPKIRYPDGTEIAPQITLRLVLDLYAGVRPIKLYPGTPSPLALPPGRTIDYVIFRENTEGLFASRGGGATVGDSIAVDSLVITRFGTERIVRRAFEWCQKRAGAPADGARRVTCVDKANMFRSYALFRQVFQDVAREYPGIDAEYAYVDAMSMYLTQAPWRYDVIVLENMFGDILSDLGAATVGGLGMAPSGDIGDRWALFQPSHGTAPDIVGKAIANPLAMILSAAMMLRWLGERRADAVARQAAERIEKAVSTVLATGTATTRDIGGNATTPEVGDAVLKALS